MKIALIGLGEVGRVLAEDLAASAVLTAWDVAFVDPVSPATHNARDLGLIPAASAQHAVDGADLVISAVTAANDGAAARSVAAGLRADAFFLDVNSASPASKQAAARVITDAGGRYVEAAVMSPIEPRRLAAPILLGGPAAAAFADVGAALGFSGLEVYADTIGPAAATKLCRSVVVKGLETLLLESMIAARQWGVEDQVLASLDNILPGADWPDLARYMLARAIQHGTRRSEEMDEAAETVAAAGIEPLLTRACARQQDWAAGFGPSRSSTGSSGTGGATTGSAADGGSVAAIVDRINARRSTLTGPGAAA